MTGARQLRRLLVFVAAAAVLAAGTVWYRGGFGNVVGREHCSAAVDGRTVDLSPEQAENAATIAAIGKRRGLPARAVTIALAAAYQESKIKNLEDGHADSLGLFQQRPSVGVWGTATQIRDPYHATNKFYDALVKVDDYQNLEVTVAAQRVQRSAYPDAYAGHEADARVLASALTGNSPAAFTCRVRVSTAQSDPQELSATLAAEIERAFGPLPVRFRATGSDLDAGPATANTTNARGWAIAHWLVANAERLRLAEVRYDGQVWRAQQSARGWEADIGEPGAQQVRVEFASKA